MKKITVIQALNREIHRIAFDANLYDAGLADNPTCANRARRRRELLEAINEIQGNDKIPGISDYEKRVSNV